MSQERLLSIVTALDPARAHYVDELSKSVARCKEALAPTRWSLEWIVALDGGADATLASRLAGARVVGGGRGRSGVAAARNVAAVRASGTWVLPLDGDDLVDADGVARISRVIAEGSPKAVVAGNRMVLDHESGRLLPGAHYHDQPRHWPAGRLAEDWTAPFRFHPNAVVVNAEMLSRVGGWPATEVNEDLGLVLLLSELGDVQFLPFTVVHARRWAGQLTASPSYAAQKDRAFRWIESSLNLLRASRGRPLVAAPDPGGSFGRDLG
jgi:glycosyltransferase involved in cell wall biosynthesis